MKKIFNKISTPELWAIWGLLLIGLIFARILVPEHTWAVILIAVFLVALLGLIGVKNKKSLTGRTAAFGLNSAVTALLVLGLVGVVNFLSARHPLKWDTTENNLHTLSQQTRKIVKSIDKDVKIVLFSKISEREKNRSLLENYKDLNPMINVEYVDPDKEPTRARTADIKKYNTLILESGEKTSKIEDVTEEKLTNALIKLLQQGSKTFCSTSGHGEKSLESREALGYDAVKKGLADQSYTTKTISIIEQNQIPEDCNALAIIGPTKGFFPEEMKIIEKYMDDGGKVLMALDVDLKGSETAPELISLLKKWYIDVSKALIVDPLSRIFGRDASIAVIDSYSPDHSITQDFSLPSQFPFSRPVEVLTGAPSSLALKWLGKSKPSSWGEAGLKELTKGAVKFTEGSDKKGPLTIAVAAEGKLKDSTAKEKTRLVVFGSSNFATNNYSRFGGNLDLFLNAASWLLQDDSLISIRSKESSPGKVELSQKSGQLVFWLTVIIIPALVSVGGIVNWVRRKRL